MTGITITHEQFGAFIEEWKSHEATEDGDDFRKALSVIGITIAPPSPSPEMVKLAREIVATCRHPADIGEGCWSPEWVAIAALQHVERVVRDEMETGGMCDAAAILTAIGSK